ncbi:hypothetical protein UlMin_039227 [Ulmus minor]
MERVISMILLLSSYFNSISAQSHTYIVHMDQSAMPRAFPTHHNWFMSTLSSVSDNSKIPVTSKVLHTYTNSIHGFSATLTPTELEALKKTPGYVHSVQDRRLRAHTTHTSGFLGLSTTSGAWPASSYGEDVIIGVVDTGIWPESKSFSDVGMTKVPSRWKGKCVSSTQFNSSLCNRKLIGARFYNKGLLADDPKFIISMNSTRDDDGHGTHTSSIAAGNYVERASYFGYAPGIARGMAPKARLAMYKTVWSKAVYSSDVLAAIDQAIADGVDILSVSLGLEEDTYSLEDNTIAIASFAAMKKGIFVSASAGNGGPMEGSVINAAPWMTTVGASMVDRQFKGVLNLGNGTQITFQSLYPGNYSQTKVPLVFIDACSNVKELKKLKGKIVVCEDKIGVSDQVDKVQSARVVSGAVFITNESLSDFYTRSTFPAVFLGPQDGQKVINYVKQSKNPTAKLEFRKTVFGIKPAPKVAEYSSRGPYLSCPSVLKPDLLAPGTSILASWSPYSSVADLQSGLLFNNFNIDTGTSMAAPHVAGVAALIKAVHPDWRPSAIRSALMTTANPLDNTHTLIKDEANSNIPGLEVGAGHIDPNKAIDPGLIYDATPEDYINYLCGLNYTKEQIQTITNSKYNCVNRSLDLNYPSFIAYFNIDDGSNPTMAVVHEFRRTLTNVGKESSSYSAKLTAMNGLKLKVEPERLVFKKKYEKLSYKLTIEGPKLLKEDSLLGSLSWVEDTGKYIVRSPIVATSFDPEFLKE